MSEMFSHFLKKKFLLIYLLPVLRPNLDLVGAFESFEPPSEFESLLTIFTGKISSSSISATKVHNIIRDGTRGKSQYIYLYRQAVLEVSHNIYIYTDKQY